MRFRNALTILMLVLLLMAGSAAATRCVIYVLDENDMAVGSARIYMDNQTTPIGITAYNAGLGRSAWVGDIQTGEHTLTAKWERARPNVVYHQGSAMVNITGDSTMRITIATHRV